MTRRLRAALRTLVAWLLSPFTEPRPDGDDC
jgi:hypothetical protein